MLQLRPGGEDRGWGGEGVGGAVVPGRARHRTARDIRGTTGRMVGGVLRWGMRVWGVFEKEGK